MATSNSINFNETRNQIIQDAFDLLNVIDPTTAIPAADQIRGERTLNQLVKSWQAEGIKLWNKTEAAIFPDKGINIYALGGGGDTHAALVDDYRILNTTVAATTGDFDITVNEAAVSPNDYFGVTMEDGNRFWSQVSSIAGNIITLNDAITADVSDHAKVIVHTAPYIDRPQQLTNMRVLDLHADSERVTDMLAYKDYMEIPQKSAPGVVNQFMYDRGLIDIGKVYVWPTPDSVDNILRITIAQSLEDFDTATDTPDFPQEWLLALSYNLAVYLAPVYGKYTEVQALKPMADQLKLAVLWYDNEIASMSIEPDYNR